MQGCKAPQKCYAYVTQLLAQIRPKWHPDLDQTPDGLSLTPGRKASNETAMVNGTDILFDPSVTSDAPIEEAFRAFVDPMTHDRPPALRKRPGRTVLQEACTVYILEEMRYPRQENEPTHTGIGFTDSTGTHPSNSLVRPNTEDEEATQGSGLVAAALYAVARTPKDAPLRLVSNSATLREILSEKRQRWEDQGWTGVKGACQI